MDNNEEQLVGLHKLDDDRKELFQRIKEMDKQKIFEGIIASSTEVSDEELFREDMRRQYKTEADFYNFSLEDNFSLENVYELNSNNPKISVNSIIEKILKYTEILYAENLSGKEGYSYREVTAYRDLIATIIYRSSLSIEYDPDARKSIADKTLKQNGSNIKITNKTIPGLVIYVLFLAKSKRFYKYHSIYKSNKNENLKEYELKLYYKYYDRIALHINLNNMLYADSLNCLDAWYKITLFLEDVQKKLKGSGVSYSQSLEIQKIIDYFIKIKNEKAKLIKILLHYDVRKLQFREMSTEEWKNAKLQLLCKALLEPTTKTIDKYEDWIISDEKNILMEYLGRVSSNPNLDEYIENSNQEQREYLFNEWEKFKSIIDNEINLSKK